MNSHKNSLQSRQTPKTIFFLNYKDETHPYMQTSRIKDL